MMIKKNKMVLILAIIFLVAAVAGVSWFFLGKSDAKLFSLIKNKPELTILFDKAKKAEEDIVKNPDKVSLYLDVGFYWKSIGELGGGEPFFKKSLAIYEVGIKKFGEKNIVFYLNGGKLAERVGDYDKAEKYYRKAMEISPADESGYINLVELYSFTLKKSKEEVLKIFEDGLKIMANPIPLVASRASYLRRIGEYEMALKDYEILIQLLPSNTLGYQEIIKEIKEKIK